MAETDSTVHFLPLVNAQRRGLADAVMGLLVGLFYASVAQVSPAVALFSGLADEWYMTVSPYLRATGCLGKVPCQAYL